MTRDQRDSIIKNDRKKVKWWQKNDEKSLQKQEKKLRRKLAKERFKRIKQFKKNGGQKHFNNKNFNNRVQNGNETQQKLKDYSKMSIVEKLKYNIGGSNFFKNTTRTFVNGVQITFLGATKTVTGSKYLIECEKSKILIDCGLFQGMKELRARNRDKLPINPKYIDAIILTHAHLDHSGYIPLLVKEGFNGKIYCTKPTLDLCKLILPDSGFLQEEDARYAKKKGYSKHLDPKPLYTQKDAMNSLKRFFTIDFHKEIKINDDFSFSMTKAGHILGAGSVLLKTKNGKSILFSGDVGRFQSTLVTKPENLPAADYMLCETTYGERLHIPTNKEELLQEIINKTVTKGGKVIIPAFAVGRSQEIIYYIHRLMEAGKIPTMPIFLDSPMSIKVTHLADDYANEGKLTKEEYKSMHKNVRFCVTQVQSKKILDFAGPAIIISASGMLEGGRILHHIANFGPQPNCTIVLTGYQAEGTRGRDLIDGKPEIKIHGKMIPIRAKVEKLTDMSAHADANELIEWLKTMPTAPKKLFAVHGEVEQAEAFANRVRDELHWNVEVPNYLETIKL